MRRLGSRYSLIEVVGRGATGEVWRGQDHAGNPFAFKILKSSIVDDQEAVRRFVHERHLMLSLDDPHLVRIHDMVVEGETLAIVMEFVDGGDLGAHLRQLGKLEPIEACVLVSDIADGLSVIHAAGIIHRDVKPENVLLDRSGSEIRPRITDFSIARITSGATQSTMMAGTPSYVAPELFDDKPPTVASDLYGLGIVLYELLAGQPPFKTGSLLSMMRMHANERPPHLADIPPAVWRVLERLLAKDPDDRPSSAMIVASELRALALPAKRRAFTTDTFTPAAHPVPTQFPAVAPGANEMLSVSQPGPSTPIGQGDREPHSGRPQRLAAAVAAILMLLTMAGITFGIWRTTANEPHVAASPQVVTSTVDGTPKAAKAPFRCWDDGPSDSLDDCPPPTGLDGIRWMLPELRVPRNACEELNHNQWACTFEGVGANVPAATNRGAGIEVMLADGATSYLPVSRVDEFCKSSHSRCRELTSDGSRVADVIITSGYETGAIEVDIVYVDVPIVVGFWVFQNAAVDQVIDALRLRRTDLFGVQL